MDTAFYDVLVVGGGPAGSTFASSLKASGLKIAILDKAVFPRQKTCAGWVTPEVMRLLDVDLADYAKDRVLQKIHGFRLSMLGQKQLESRHQLSPVSYGIRRIEFDDYLLQRCGAQLLLNEAFDNMEKIDEGWLVNDRYRAKLVVGAGGHYCPVARAIGAKSISERAVVAQEVEFEMNAEQKQSCTISEQVPELFFTPDLKGYGWVFRKADYLNIGLGREDKNRLSSHVKGFCEYLTEQGKIPRDITEKYNGHAYLLYNHAARQMIADRVLLIGDAAGLACPQSGEGIRPAVESAILAAAVVSACDGEYRESRLQAYKNSIELRFGERQPKADFIESLPLLVKKTFARQLLKTHWFTEKVVINRWFLQSQQPGLPAIDG